jgi:hypothetical protein
LLRTWIIIKPQYSLVYFIQKQRRFLSWLKSIIISTYTMMTFLMQMRMQAIPE